MQAHEKHRRWLQSLRGPVETSPVPGVLALLAVVAVATLLRLPGLTDNPPGFRHEEASVALAAQQIERGFFPIYFHDEATTIEPAFVYAVNLAGQLVGWDATGPRLAAAVLGVAVAAGCMLWFRQVMGTAWGLAGGLLVATSFWQMVFSRQAVPEITMAVVGAFGLWALFRAIERRTHRDERAFPSAWYGVAGLLFGLGIYAGVTMRATIPVVLVIGVFLLFKQHNRHPVADRRGMLLGTAVMLLVAAPLVSYFWQEPDIFRQGIDTLRGDGSILENTRTTLDALFWSGSADPAHTLSGRAVLDPILVVWGAIGLVVALRRPLVPIHAVAVIWLAGFLATVVFIAPGRHDQMLALTPVLFLFPVLGMRATVDLARRRGERLGVTALAIVTVSIAGSAGWSIASYSEWTADDDTYRAFSGDVRDAIDALPERDGIIIYFATGEHGRIVRYLAPEGPRRDIENPNTLPLPETGPAYLAIPESAGMPESLTAFLGNETLVAEAPGPDSSPAFHIWLIDDRVRERLPYAVPGIFFRDGPALIGYDISPRLDAIESREVEVVLVYRIATGGDTFTSMARLIDLPDDTVSAEGTPVQPAPDGTTPHDEIILSSIVLPFPETPDMVADLHTAVAAPDGSLLEAYGPNVIVYDEVWALLNAIGYIGPDR